MSDEIRVALEGLDITFHVEAKHLRNLTDPETTALVEALRDVLARHWAQAGSNKGSDVEDVVLASDSDADLS